MTCEGKYIHLNKALEIQGTNFAAGSFLALTEDDEETPTHFVLDGGDGSTILLAKVSEAELIQTFEVGKFYRSPIGFPFYVCGNLKTEISGNVLVLETPKGLMGLPKSAQAKDCKEITREEFWEETRRVKTLSGVEANGTAG